ncbi:prevent-host-death family protein [Actinoalloteichus hoggarensis]|uniref:Putative antitoxin VapB5 n=1 Tax=Actinoalloteichus hoggarensis TaxID=1470176 RepID=A0A221VZ52_9PSEU|nr:type II toxin-antitoxin system prevent-host-death family antitoxin [Actinoalloteichus hoggarensis]ASO18813.1 Putative antitoxin VapB5 [Actinoalloteichus hoggarensis]MBB5920046.1 prevent-host-death family protein [Actinoalloteichus hoggarensis]
MSQRIGSRELRRDEAEVVRRVEAGERFTVTRAGRPVADLVPHRPGDPPSAADRTLGAVQAEFRGLPSVDAARWERDRRRADSRFGPDDPSENPWNRGTRHGSAVAGHPDSGPVASNPLSSRFIASEDEPTDPRPAARADAAPPAAVMAEQAPPYPPTSRGGRPDRPGGPPTR